VLLEREEQDVYVLLVVPSLFLSRPGARLYGYKAREYKSNRALIDLPHRNREELGRVKQILSSCWSTVAGRIWPRAREESIVTREDALWAERFFSERGEDIW
jgi:hypothetical protein